MKEMICRLCLQTIGTNNNCQTVEESLLKSLKLNINISEENVMCTECANCLRVFSNFISGSAYNMKEKTLPLSDLDNGIKLDPEAINITANLKSVLEKKINCSFCTKAHGREDLISLEESKDNKFMVNVLERYILEKKLKSIEELLACKTCHKSLDGVLNVILKCLEVEETISKYIELEGTNDKGQVELKKVQQSMFKPILKSEFEFVEIQECTRIAETKIKYEKEIGNTELIIKTEDESEQNDCDISNIKLEESDCNGFQELFIEHQSSPEIKMFQCEAKTKMFKCELCPYETKYNNTYKRHLLVHKSPLEIKMFKCALCSYETKYKNHLRQHSLIHRSSSEINMFKCELCPHETKYKNAYKQHALIHKSPSEIKMFKCELCSYEAKQKGNLTQHLLTHKSRFETKMFKCALCSYEGKQKYGLKKHLWTHKSRTEIKMFKCELCSHEAKCRANLKRHILTHKNPSEIEMFKCALCPYEAKRKYCLERHLLTHKSPFEIKMFKCVFCLHETKLKSSLKKHLLTHKTPS